MITISDQLEIPEEEVEITASRSSGPGGQNVNKVNTRVTLHFSVWSSKCLTESQKAKIIARLNTRITKDGILYLHAQGTRSQAMNRVVLLERFAMLLGDALTPTKPRKKTKVPYSTVLRRLDHKKQRGGLKHNRQKPRSTDD